MTPRPIKLKAIRKEYIWGTEDWVFSYLHPELVESIPLLIKVITAREALSVQVHPGDDFAREEEHSNGKTEMWYVLDAEEDACVYYGLKHKISPNEFIKRIRNESILEVCRRVPVKKGDVFYIPAGLLHAIGKGVTVAEIQQSSNITYRVYDYNRVDAKQQKRPLHIEKAAKVAGFMPPLQGHRPMGARVQREGYSRTLLVQCPYFIVHLCEVEEKLEETVGDSFRSLLILEGEGTLEDTEAGCMWLKAGDSIFLPAGMGAYRLTGRIKLLMSEVP